MQGNRREWRLHMRHTLRVLQGSSSRTGRCLCSLGISILLFRSPPGAVGKGTEYVRIGRKANSWKRAATRSAAPPAHSDGCAHNNVSAKSGSSAAAGHPPADSAVVHHLSALAIWQNVATLLRCGSSPRIPCERDPSRHFLAAYYYHTSDKMSTSGSGRQVQF